MTTKTKTATPKPKRPAKAAAPKRPKARKLSTPAPAPTAAGSEAPMTKTDMLVHMMQRPGGATSKDMEAATGWASHSVRGLLGILRKRGVVVHSHKEKGARTSYRIGAGAAPEVEDVI